MTESDPSVGEAWRVEVVEVESGRTMSPTSARRATNAQKASPSASIPDEAGIAAACENTQ